MSRDEQMTADSTAETRIDPADWDEHIGVMDIPQIVVGGPGTGKSQFLVARAASGIANGMTPESMVVLAFSRSGADDLRQRLVEAVGQDAHRINVSTYHSLAMRIVEAHADRLGWDRPPSVLTAAEHENFVADILADEPPASWPPGYRTLLDSPVMAAEVTDFILRCHEQNVTATDLGQSSDDRFVAMAGFFERYDERLRAAHRTDYGRILTEATEALARWPDVAAPYELVLADEYQDSSPSQAEMLFALAKPSGRLMVAADPYQSIYSFRGTDIANVFSFPNDAKERLGTGAERLVLTTSFRVPSEILAAAVSVTARELPGGAGKVQSIRSGGSVVAHTFATVSDEAEWIASDIERVHLVDGVATDRIAVFMRSQSEFGPELAAALARRAIPHSFTESRLADEPIIQFIHNLVLATGDDEEAQLAIQRVLMSPYVALSYGTVNDLARQSADDQTTQSTSWAELIESKVPEGKALAALLKDPAWAHDVPAPAGLWHVWSTLPQLVAVALNDEHAADRAAWSAFDQVLTRATERSPGTSLSDHWQLLIGSDYEADPLYSFRLNEAVGVTISTLHRAKGTEFDVVYIAHAVEGQLPDLRSRDSLLGVRLLNPHLPTDTGKYVAFRLDEERRLAYTAMTRATSRVVWTATSNDSVHDGLQPSRFLHLVAPATAPELAAEPLTARSFEALLRRTARNPLATPVERLAALDVLAEGTSAGLAEPLSRYGTKAPGPDTGITPDPLRLSPSQAGAYAKCPRQYAISRFVISQDPENNYLRFGTLIHTVVEKAEQAAFDNGEERSTRDQAQRRLDALWPDFGFGDDAVGRSWRGRAEGTLDSLYSLWPTSGAPVAFESDLRTTIADTQWLGRADRIEKRGDDLFIVDYKTSGTATTKIDAASSMQLGFYMHAAMQDETLTDHGTIVGAEFWYPRAKPNKYSIATRSFDPANLDDVRTELSSITENIRAEAFEPIVGKQCDTCEVALVCPAIEAGSEAFAR